MAKCGNCNEEPCVNPKVCRIAIKARDLANRPDVHAVTGNCRGCNDGKPKGHSYHVCGKLYALAVT